MSLKNYFELDKHKTTVRTEVIAGITTFFAMAYIIFVNPTTLADPFFIQATFEGIAGTPKAEELKALGIAISNSVFFATCIAAFVGTMLMGLLAKLPFAQASGMGLNAFFAYTVILTLGFSFQEALALVFISGILFIIITVFGLREAVVRAIPKNIKIAISGGIGLFIAFIGLKNAGLVVNNDATAVSLVDFSIITKKVLPNGMTQEVFDDKKLAVLGAIVALIGLVIIGVLFALRVKGAILIGIVATTIISIPFGIAQLDGIVESFKTFGPTFATQWGDFLEYGVAGFVEGFKSLFGDKNLLQSLLTIIVVVISFSLVDMFDTIGTLLGTARKADMLDENGELPEMKKALLCDAIATTTGAILGTSTVTTYVESSAGVAEGGRTGLTSVVTAILFLVAIPLAPIIHIIPSQATAPALIFVGALMIGGIKEINFDDMTDALPAFLTIAMMPLTYSIANGIAFGLIFHTLLKVCTGKIKEVNIVTAILAALFIVRFFLMGM